MIMLFLNFSITLYIDVLDLKPSFLEKIKLRNFTVCYNKFLIKLNDLFLMKIVKNV